MNLSTTTRRALAIVPVLLLLIGGALWSRSRRAPTPRDRQAAEAADPDESSDSDDDVVVRRGRDRAAPTAPPGVVRDGFFPDDPEQVVTVFFRTPEKAPGVPDDNPVCRALANLLEHDLEGNDAGELDGNHGGAGECKLVAYGPDADRLFLAIERTVRAYAPARGGSVTKRYGSATEANAREARISL